MRLLLSGFKALYGSLPSCFMFFGYLSIFSSVFSSLSSKCAITFLHVKLTGMIFPFSFHVHVLRGGPTSCGITAGATVCITWIFQQRHRSSAKCLRSCCALRSAAIFPVTFCSATPSGVGACSSVQLPKNCVWMHVKYKKQTWMPKQLISLVLLYTCWNATLFFWHAQ